MSMKLMRQEIQVNVNKVVGSNQVEYDPRAAELFLADVMVTTRDSIRIAMGNFPEEDKHTHGDRVVELANSTGFLRDFLAGTTILPDSSDADVLRLGRKDPDEPVAEEADQ